MRRRRGYVLVMTLGLLMLASTLLVVIGRAAIRQTLLARTEQQALQRRWGQVSCRNAVLPYASLILARQEALEKRPVPVMQTNIRLGRDWFNLIVSDEQAKANLNSILQQADRSRTESRVREALSGTGLGNMVRLRPEPLARASEPPARPGEPVEIPRWISGFGQVLNNVPPDRLLSPNGPAARLTCWGNGAINLMRVSEASLKLAAAPTLTNIEITRLLEARDAAFAPRPSSGIRGLAGQPQTPANLDAIGQLLAKAKVDPKVRLTVALTSSSTCYSLWIVWSDGFRRSYRLYVSDESNPQFPRIESFVW